MEMAPNADPPTLAEELEQCVDTHIGSAFELFGIGPLSEGKRADAEVRYVVGQDR